MKFEDNEKSEVSHEHLLKKIRRKIAKKSKKIEGNEKIQGLIKGNCLRKNRNL